MSQRAARILRYLEIGLAAVVVGLAAYVIAQASGWELQARLFPWVVSFPLLALAGVQLLLTVRSAPLETAAADEASPADDLGLWNPQARRELLRLGFWIAIFMLCITLLSFPFGLPLAVLLYLKIESGERWPLSVLLAGSTFAYLYLLFDLGLHVPWPEGLLTALLFPR